MDVREAEKLVRDDSKVTSIATGRTEGLTEKLWEEGEETQLWTGSA